MTQYLNQFSQSPEKGMLDLRYNSNTLSCKANNTTIIAGQAVRLANVAGKIPVVEPATDTDQVFGYANLNLKQSTFNNYDMLEVSITGNVMYMVAGAAIASGADIMHVVSTGYVITAAGTTKCISGSAIDKATALGDLIRVYVRAFGLPLVRPAA